ncbi:unnamed protein product [Clonostachys rosea]|uniref:DUF6604 domain-containing protein n=1 Tax=Bionectria ochroleuca TaxID=29856 RepID=A0ABY6TW24_BIOOC|nr:unnamed protein product [Clonostachys rosea]
MADKEVSSIYKRYKKDTDSVASWLARTAAELSYPLDLISTQPDPPGKTKYIIPLHDFIQLSNFITQRRKQVNVPASFFMTVDRLIDLRSGFGKLLMKNGKTLSSKDKADQDYFVNILRGFRGLLCPNHKPKPTVEAVSPLHEREEDPSSSDRDVRNRFSALSIDEPSEAFLKRFAAESQIAERPSQPTDDATIIF